MKTAPLEAKPPLKEGIGGYRWAICILLFFATTINYIDRQVLSVLAPDLQKALHWNEVDYANIVSAFQITYAIGQVLTGFIVDRIGTFAGFAIFVTIWSIVAMSSEQSMGGCRPDFFGHRGPPRVVSEFVHALVRPVSRTGGWFGHWNGGRSRSLRGLFIATFAGFILETTKSYVPLFLIAGTAYLVAFGIIQLLFAQPAPSADRRDRGRSTVISNQ